MKNSKSNLILHGIRLVIFILTSGVVVAAESLGPMVDGVQYASPMGCGEKTWCLPGRFNPNSRVTLFPTKEPGTTPFVTVTEESQTINDECSGPIVVTKLRGPIAGAYFLAAVGGPAAGFLRLPIKTVSDMQTRHRIDETVRSSNILEKLEKEVLETDNAVLLLSTPTVSVISNVGNPVYAAKYQVRIGSEYLGDGPSVLVSGDRVQQVGTGCSWITDRFLWNGTVYALFRAGGCASGWGGEVLWRIPKAGEAEPIQVNGTGGC